MSGEKASALNSFDQIPQNRVSDCHSVKSGSSSAELVDNSKTVSCSMLDYAFGLFHFYKEGAFSLLQFVGCSYPCENPVYDLTLIFLCRDINTILCKNNVKAGGSEKS